MSARGFISTTENALSDGAAERFAVARVRVEFSQPTASHHLGNDHLRAGLVQLDFRNNLPDFDGL